MNNNFDNAIKQVLAHESGYVNDPVDPGGETNMGISKRSYPNEDIKGMTVERAQQIYHDDYWIKGGYDKIDSSIVAVKTFDMSVNMGVRRATKILQQSLNEMMGNYLVVDGMMGKKTLSAINKSDSHILLDNIRHNQAEFYEHLIARTPSLVKYRNGWMKRAFT